ncbi:SprB repeat-containing protein, partial [Flavobacterium sp. UMI-01]|uniref:SprB repeat-containing protein n=1 Tax=Flavobacterium sp. UMI-01 TaxID=1441053 RepID=UPI001C7D1443
ATAIIVNNNNCVGCSNGSIDITVSGGTTPYSYTWSNGAITQDLNSLAIGKYDLEIKDANGCFVNYTYFITESGIEILKDAVYQDTNNDGITNLGDNIIYSFIVKNTGNVDLTNVTITDTKATINGGAIATLTAGTSDNTTFTAIHAITQADINTGIYYNLATANAKDPENFNVTNTSTDPTPCTSCPKDPECSDCTITELNQSPSISITKDGTYVDSNNDGKTNV